MRFASEDLKNEHSGILHGLKILERIVQILNRNGHVDIDDIRDVISFFRIFADKCHHGKEETFLFPAIRAIGNSEINELINELMIEHKDGRLFIQQMESAFKINAFDSHTFRSGAENYSKLIQPHIDNENTHLFPFADSHLDSTHQTELLVKFEEFENTIMGSGTHDKLHTMLGRLEKRYLISS
jgi:hemerythrin-like domain-containing protein